MKYPAPGAPDLAKKVHELLTASGFESVHIDKERGLGHSTWVPLMLMYPEANIPVCELSIQPHLNGAYHYNLGRALAPLKDDGVLIIGSGSATNPSCDTTHCGDGVAPWAAEFDSWLDTALTDGRYTFSVFFWYYVTSSFIHTSRNDWKQFIDLYNLQITVL